MKKIAIAAGGTGGHLFPAYAFYETIISSGYSPDSFFFVSQKDEAITAGWNARKVKLKIIGLPRKISFSIVLFLIYLIGSFFKSLKIIFKEKPCLVIGFGGYVSVAPLLAAVVARVPVVIHEQNVVPGKVNRLLSFFAVRIMTGLDATVKYWSKQVRRKVMFTGIPVRQTANKKITKPLFKNNDCFTVLIIGGSQGALVFNTWVAQILDNLKELTDTVRFIHLTGKKDTSRIKSVYDEYGFVNRCFGFYDNMADIYTVTDFAVCRAGAGTLTELALAGIPAVVIPYPYATDNHQLRNAELFSDAGAVEIIEEKNCTPQILAQRIKYYLRNKVQIERMRTAMRKLAVPDAGIKITGIINKIIDEKY